MATPTLRALVTRTQPRETEGLSPRVELDELPVVDPVVPFENLAEAYAALAAGGVFGTIVLPMDRGETP